jgi:hypothetical protein
LNGYRRIRSVQLLKRRPRQAGAAWAAAIAVLGTLVLPAAAAAQDLYSWSVGALGGLGGSVDVSPGSKNVNNASWQLEGLALTEARTIIGLRVGHLDLGGKDTVFGSRVGADLSYVTLAGQYMFEESYYDSGIYLGLGGYQLGGRDALTGSSATKTSLGGVLGITGEFKATRRIGVLLELSGHYIDAKDSHVFAMGHAGVAFHF